MAAGAPGGLLSPALFQARVIPVLLRLFAVHEEHVRVVLLSHLEAYVEHFTPEQLRKVILPQVRHGRRGLRPEPGRARGSSRSWGAQGRGWWQGPPCPFRSPPERRWGSCAHSAGGRAPAGSATIRPEGAEAAGSVAFSPFTSRAGAWAGSALGPQVRVDFL